MMSAKQEKKRMIIRRKQKENKNKDKERMMVIAVRQCDRVKLTAKWRKD